MIAVLNPKGLIALQEYHLMIVVTLLMLIVVIPVFVLTFVIAWRYRASNTKATYTPDHDHNSVVESLWWAIPTIIILIISGIIWKSSHDLDPYKSLASTNRPLTIQVVALNWKWLFIYPEQGIATVNVVEFPENTPINFEITADAPMNSFWIPQLGGQIYAMPGMSTELHLIAGSEGIYDGSSANISGVGFSGMKFKAQSVSQDQFNQWMTSVKSASTTLNKQTYTMLAQPSENNPVATYSSVEQNLYNDIIMKYMMNM